MGLFGKKIICGVCERRVEGTYYPITRNDTKQFCYNICQSCRNNLVLALGVASFPLDPKMTKSIIDNARQPNGQIERKVRCKSCDKIFCYTNKDLERNAALREQARIARNMGIASTLFDSTIAGNQHDSEAARYESQIVDYNKCPHCGSTDLEILDKESYEKYKAEHSKPQPEVNNSANPSSVADELKKFKELLDMNVITQEEFDAKKKELLGL